MAIFMSPTGPVRIGGVLGTPGGPPLQMPGQPVGMPVGPGSSPFGSGVPQPIGGVPNRTLPPSMPARPRGGLNGIFQNRGRWGSGGKGTLQDLMKGINAEQLARMQHGMNPGGFQGDFKGMSAARLMQLAHIIAAQYAGPQPGGQPPALMQLQHHRGDGLFGGGGLMGADRRGLQQMNPRGGRHFIGQHPLMPM